MLARFLRETFLSLRSLGARYPSTALVACGLLGLVAMAVTSLAATTVVLRYNVNQQAMDRLGRNILVVERVLRDLGPVRLQGSHLMAGGVMLDEDTAFVDEMSSMVGGYVTVFRGDVRIATTIFQNGRRAVGTHLAPGPARDALFDHHQAYRGPASVLGKDLYAAYDPLRGPDGRIIGAVFIGLPRTQFRNLVTAIQRTITVTSFAFLILAALAFSAVARPLKREIDNRERNLEQLAHQLDIALENMSDGLCLYDCDQRLVVSNARYATLYGLIPERITPGITLAEMLKLREDVGALTSGWDAATALLSHEQIHAGNLAREVIVKTTKGQVLVVRHQRLADGGWVATHSDVTLQMRDQERMRFLVLHDSLTGLANREAFNNAMSAYLDDQGRISFFMLFLIDLDRFKEINDVFGHCAGDAVLRGVGMRLRHFAKDVGVVARLAGDEFTLLVKGVPDAGSPEALAQGILDALSVPFVFEGATIRSGASVGVTVVNSSLTPDEVFGQADLALYTAKQRGRGVFEMFRPELAVARQRRRELEGELLAALDNGEFVLHYQPQYAVTRGTLLGFEALVRWQHPSRGLLYPGDFIAVAEETGLIVRLGAWVMEQACRAASAWPGNVRVAVNVSAVQFLQPSFVANTIRAMSETGLRPDRLEVEVTETVLLEDTPEIVNVFSALRQAGIRVALDDFGTGYSSLLYLRRLPFDCIKIDQAFVRDLETSPDAASIVATIIQLARSFRATTVAEGVEEPGQLARLRVLGCDVAQGFHFSRPIPLEAAMELIAAGSSFCNDEFIHKPLHLRLI